MKTLVTTLFLALLLTTPIAQADWKGTLKVSGGGVEKEDGSGQIFSSHEKIRVELSARGQQMVILADAKGGKASMLMPAQKMVMEMPASMADKKMLTCSADDIEGCLKRKGYKKTGTDTVDGHPCAIYEGDEKHGTNQAHQKIWRPTDLKEVFMIKSVTSTGNGEVTTLVKDIKVGKLDAGLFKVPGEFKKIQMPDIGNLAK